MYEAVMANWEGYEDLLRQVLDLPQHYGNNDGYADAVIKWCMDIYTAAVCRGSSVRGRCRPGLFKTSSNVFAGERAWATPDGRKAGESLSD